MELEKNNTATTTNEYTGNTHGTTNTDLSNNTNSNTNGETNTNSNQNVNDYGNKVPDDFAIEDNEQGVNPVIEINPKLNLMVLSKDQFDENEKNEDESLVLNRFNGQPVVIYDMGPEDEYVQAMTSEYSKYCHPYINLVYGYRYEDKNLLIVREHVHGKNYYSVANYVNLGDRLIAFYKCLTLIEYIHSFKAFLRIIKPEKFILGGGLTTVKLVDCIKHDNRYLTKIQNLNKIDDANKSMRFICPELYFEDLGENSLERSIDYEVVRRSDYWTIGCFLYYAITTKLPWANYNTKEEIKKDYDNNKLFYKDEDIKTDDGKPITESPMGQFLLDSMRKCFENTLGEDTTELRVKLEERPNIAQFISENGGDLEMDYQKGN